MSEASVPAHNYTDILGVIDHPELVRLKREYQLEAEVFLESLLYSSSRCQIHGATIGSLPNSKAIK